MKYKENIFRHALRNRNLICGLIDLHKKIGYNEETMDIPKFLRSTFLFSSFNDEELKLLHLAAKTSNFHKGETIFSDGTKADAFFLVAKGKVKVYKVSPDGMQHILHIHIPGDPVAEAAIFDAMSYPASCTALEDTTLIRIGREGFIDLLKAHPELSLKIMSGYSKRLRQFVAQLEELSLKDVKTRLAGHLLANSSIENGQTIYRLGYTKKELASLIGTIPETLSRALAFLKQKKLIIEKGNLIHIPDPEELKTFSG